MPFTPAAGMDWDALLKAFEERCILVGNTAGIPEIADQCVKARDEARAEIASRIRYVMAAMPAGYGPVVKDCLNGGLD